MDIEEIKELAAIKALLTEINEEFEKAPEGIKLQPAGIYARIARIETEIDDLETRLEDLEVMPDNTIELEVTNKYKILVAPVGTKIPIGFEDELNKFVEHLKQIS